MPQPQPCQATFAAGLSIFPSLVHNSPPRDGSRRRAGVECCSRARARTENGGTTGSWDGGSARNVPCRRTIVSASRLGTPGECGSRSTFASDRPCSEV